MDNLRSCYRTKVRPFRDSDVEAEIQWYFVARDAPSLPFATVFGSRNWEDAREEWGEPGEVQGAPREWVNGAKPFTVVNQGPVGSADWFLRGAPVSALGTLLRDCRNGPCVCTGFPPCGVDFDFTVQTIVIAGTNPGDNMQGSGSVCNAFSDLVRDTITPAIPNDLVAELITDGPLPSDLTIRQTLADFTFANFNGGREPQPVVYPFTLMSIPPVPNDFYNIYTSAAQLGWSVNAAPAANPQVVRGIVLYRSSTSEVVGWFFQPPPFGGYPMQTLGDVVKTTPAFYFSSKG